MEGYDIDSLRESLKNYYGTASVVMRNEDLFMGYAAVMEYFDVDEMSDEEVISKVQSLGIL